MVSQIVEAMAELVALRCFPWSSANLDLCPEKTSLTVRSGVKRYVAELAEVGENEAELVGYYAGSECER